MTKKFLFTIFTVSIFITISLFVLLCWTAAADAQGAVAFFIYVLVFLILIGLNFYLGKRVSAETHFGLVLKRISQILAVFILIFYISGFVGLTSFSQKVIELVAQSFELITGKTPLQWDKGL